MVGDIVSKSELKGWLNDCHSGQFIDKADAAAGLSSHLVRGRPGGRLTVAVGGDARPETAINAMLDLLAWHWIERRRPADAVDLLIGDGPNASYILDFYASAAADPTGYGQGQTLLGWAVDWAAVQIGRASCRERV